MATQSAEQLASKRCAACEGGVEKLSAAQATQQLKTIVGWKLSDDGLQIRKDWKTKNFSAGMAFLNEVAKLAEQERHHPDLHLEGYRHVWIATWTHAVGGLSDNDFILAAKVDQLAVSACLGEWSHESSGK